MTNETKKKLTANDYAVMCHLAEEKIVPDIRGMIFSGSSVVLEELHLDVDAIVEKYRAGANERAKAINCDRRLPYKKEVQYVGRVEVTYSPHWCDEPILSFPTKYHDLNREDIRVALEKISEPSSVLNCIKSIFRPLHPGKTHETKGYTICAASVETITYKGRTYPNAIGVCGIREDALDKARQKTVDKEMTPVEQWATRCKSMTAGQQFQSLEELCRNVSLDLGSNPDGYISVYADQSYEPAIGEDKRVSTPINHTKILDWNKDFREKGSSEETLIGTLSFRPVLSTGEVATPEVIAKYVPLQ